MNSFTETTSVRERRFPMALVAWLAVLIMLSGKASGDELVIQVTEGADRGIPMAVVPFGVEGTGDVPENLDRIIRDNLTMSGDFELLEPDRMLSLPTSREDMHFRDWRMLGQQFVLVGEVEYREDRERYVLTYELFDVSRQERVLGSRASAVGSELRTLAHHVSDRIYETITGVEGVFSTRIAFVTRTREDGEPVYRLKMSDLDGHRDRTLLRSDEPIVSPDWSPDGQHLVYVSFEGGRPAVYRQEVRSGEREVLSEFRGLNSAPAWSPDGDSILLTLSRDGSAEVYRMTLGNRNLTRLTNHWSINTEGAWSPDGQRFAFTSDRSGRPQIYIGDLDGGEPERVTFEGAYNARPRFDPKGENLYFIHGRDGEFLLGGLELESGNQMVFPRSRTDEAPAVSPNGRLVLYITRDGGDRSLELTTTDGRAQFRLPIEHEGIRDPTWGPLR